MHGSYRCRELCLTSRLISTGTRTRCGVCSCRRGPSNLTHPSHEPRLRCDAMSMPVDRSRLRRATSPSALASLVPSNAGTLPTRHCCRNSANECETFLFAQEPAAARNIAFCIGQLALSDKALRRLADLWKVRHFLSGCLV